MRNKQMRKLSRSVEATKQEKSETTKGKTEKYIYKN